MEGQERNPAAGFLAAEDLNRILLDAMPICGNCWNDSFEIIFCNEAAVGLFGLSCKQEYFDKFFLLSPEFQQNGQLSEKSFLNYLRKAFDEGSARFEWMHRTLDGELIPAEITLVLADYMGRRVVAGYTRDLRAEAANRQKMQEAVERAQIMLDATPLCVSFWDKNFNNVDCNQEAVKLFELSSKQEYLDSIYERSPKYQPCGRLSSDMIVESVARAFETGCLQFEWMHQKLNGEPIPAEITLIRVKYKDDYIVISYTRDLRELKATIAEMREADEYTQLMLDATPLCCNLLDRSFNNINCNQEAVKLFELSSKKEYLERFNELSPEYQPCGRLSSEMAAEKITEAFKKGYCRFEWMHRKLDGEHIPSEITLVRLKHRGEFVVAAYTRDLRELKAMLDEMHKAEADLRLARDAAEESTKAKSEFLSRMSFEMRTPMIVTNDRAEVEYFSNSLVEWLDPDNPREALNQPLLELFPHGEIRMMLQDAMESDGFVQKNYELTINGSKSWFMMRSSLMGSGKKARVFEWVDITPIIDAKNEAEIASRAKNDFLTKMSHEIRTPMNAIVGMSELILREDTVPVVSEYALSIKQAGANLITIINDILDFSKIESGKLEIVEAEYSLVSLINDVSSIIRTRITEKPIRFVVNTDSRLPSKLIGDETRLRQVLLNLLGNAVKYTREGFISLEISGNTEDGAVMLTMEVSDSGLGIKSEDITKLFDDFVQLDMIKNRGIQGTGLGLAIAKSLCQAMGGDISVSSEYGKGSTFKVVIPQKFKSGENFASVVNPDEKRVLVYEPRSLYANSVARTIENLGVRCTVAVKQSDFYNEARSGGYSYVFMPAFTLENAKKIIREFIANDKLVLFTDFGEVLPSKNVKTVSMPAHSGTIANILNGVENVDFSKNHMSDVRFTAPSANVLIVDDIATNLKVAEGLMEPYKLRVDTCLSGAEAIALTQTKRYDVIFMDHMMPEMDGIETSALIRGLKDEDGYYENVPIIALTANAVFGINEVFLQNGLNDFLSKPIETDKLNEILEKWIPREKHEKYEETRAYAPPAAFAVRGLDVKTGVYRTGGTLDNYINILAVFYKDSLERLAQIKDCAEKNDIKLYTTHIHALKGALANIGAAELFSLAGELEHAGKNENVVFINENTQRFFCGLEDLQRDISRAVSEKRAGGESAEYDLELLHRELIRLRDALIRMDIGEIDGVINILNSKRWDESTGNIIENIARHILLFDCDEALALIDGLLSR